MVGHWFLFLLVIAPLPGADEFSPSKGVKDVHGRGLAGIIVFLGTLGKVHVH